MAAGPYQCNAGGQISSVSDPPPTTAVCPNVNSYYNVVEKGGHYSYFGTGGASGTASETAWTPTWTNTGGSTWVSSECTILSPEASAGVACNFGGTLNTAQATSTANYTLAILTTPG